MTSRENPWDTPEWSILGREAMLARQLIGTGVTALGRANYADNKGEYYNAFFGLSVGIERLAKLILVADHALRHRGQVPSPGDIRKFGHKLKALAKKAEDISDGYRLDLTYPRPTNNISAAVVDCLDSFADAKRGRYANLEALGDPNLKSEFEPIQKYWAKVAEPILKKHYKGTRVEARVEMNAHAVDQMMGGISSVHFFDETGAPIQDVYSGSLRTGQTKVVQRWGRYYTLCTVRWLSDVFSQLTRKACYDHNIDACFGLWEHFWTYTVPDEFLRTRKVWPLR